MALRAGEAALMVGAPEVGIPMEIGKQLAPHASAILMMPLIALSILIIIIGISVFSTAKTKTPGAMLLMMGLLLGGGAFTVASRSEGKRA